MADVPPENYVVRYIPLLVRRGGREAAGVVAHESLIGGNDHPVCGDAAATPPHEEGNTPVHSS
jgi:hypothetical protein